MVLRLFSTWVVLLNQYCFFYGIFTAFVHDRLHIFCQSSSNEHICQIFRRLCQKSEEKSVEKKENTDLQKKLKREKNKNDIQKVIKELDDKENKLVFKVNCLKQEAKEYILEGQQKQGRKQIAEAIRLNKKIEKAVLENVYLLQNADMTVEIPDILEQTKKNLDEHQKNSDKLLDLIQEQNLSKKDQELIPELITVDNDEYNEMPEELMQEINKEKMLEELIKEDKREKVQKQNVVPGKKVGVKVPELKVKPVQQRDEIQEMIRSL